VECPSHDTYYLQVVMLKARLGLDTPALALPKLRLDKIGSPSRGPKLGVITPRTSMKTSEGGPGLLRTSSIKMALSLACIASSVLYL